MNKFIYVFNEEARDRLIRLKYTMLKSDERNGVFVFAMNGNAMYERADVSYILSDTISF